MERQSRYFEALITARDGSGLTIVTPLLNQQSLVRLLASAGEINGMGDWRVQKGSGNYGMFGLCNDDDPRYLKIVAEGGRAAQIAAVENPEMHDAQTHRLYEWFKTEVEARRFNLQTGGIEHPTEEDDEEDIDGLGDQEDVAKAILAN